MHPLTVFNGPVDTSIRTLANLLATRSEGADITMLRRLDTFVVHASDAVTWPSLHRVNASRHFAHSFRETHVRASLSFLISAGLVEEIEAGWRSTPLADAFRSIDCTYVRKMHGAARCLIQHIRRDPALVDRMDARIAEDVAAGIQRMPEDSDTRFRGLAQNYRIDLIRLEAIIATAAWIDRIVGLHPAMGELVQHSVTVGRRELDRTRTNLDGLLELLKDDQSEQPKHPEPIE